MEKKELRKQILAQRNLLSETERKAKNRAIFQHLISIPEMKSAKTILLYMDFKNEVESEPLFHWGWDLGKVMAAPATISAGRKLVPVAVDSFDDMQLSSFGVREPKLTEGLAAESIDVVLLPGVGFTKDGYRLGYGGGYYDRFLPKLRLDAITIGVGYDLQLIDWMPVEAHDVPLDMVVTETRVWNCR